MTAGEGGIVDAVSAGGTAWLLTYFVRTKRPRTVSEVETLRERTRLDRRLVKLVSLQRKGWCPLGASLHALSFPNGGYRRGTAIHNLVYPANRLRLSDLHAVPRPTSRLRLT